MRPPYSSTHSCTCTAYFLLQICGNQSKRKVHVEVSDAAAIVVHHMCICALLRFVELFENEIVKERKKGKPRCQVWSS